MRDYAMSVWRCRYFWTSLVKMDLRTRYRRSILGMGWSLLHPICMTITLCVVFHKLFDAKIEELGPYILAGMACWTYIVNSTTQGCQCFFQGEPYIRQYPAPLAIYPLRTALGATLHFLIALGVVILATWVVKGFENLPALIALAPTLLMLFLLAWSMAVIGGFANVYFQDTQHLVEVGFQILFYATPIFYSSKLLKDNELGWLLTANPAVPFLELIREPILHANIPPMTTYLTAGASVALAASIAGTLLCTLQKRIIFQL